MIYLEGKTKRQDWKKRGNGKGRTLIEVGYEEGGGRRTRRKYNCGRYKY
jgi:hypothetical protein